MFQTDRGRPRFDPDEAAAPDEVFERFPEASPEEVMALAAEPDPEVSPTAREVGELLAEGLGSDTPGTESR